MVRPEHPPISGQSQQRSMSEPFFPFGKITTSPPGQRHGCIPPNFPQRQHDAHIFQHLPFPIQISRAIGQFHRQRFIPRRRTPGRRADINPPQPQPIVPMNRFRLIRHPRPMQCREKKIPASISRENPPGPIRPMRPRRQPDNPYSRPHIPKPRHRFSPIFPIGKSIALLARDLPAILPQTGTAPALNDFRRENTQRIFRRDNLHEFNPRNAANRAVAVNSQLFLFRL